MQLNQQENHIVSMMEKLPKSVPLSEPKGDGYGSISERVAAVRENGKQGIACDAGFGN
jgi:hypothetical protein